MAAEIPDGAVLVARAILNSSLWTMRVEDRVVAIACICMANWKPRKWFDGKEERLIRRGEFVTSREHLAEASKLSIQEVRTSLLHLEKVGFLTRTSTSRYTVLYIPKYDHYQDFSKYYPTKEPTSHQPAPNQPLTSAQPAPNHKQEGNKGDKGEEGKETPLPPYQGGGDVPFGDSHSQALDRIYKNFRAAKIIGRADTLRDYVAGWAKRVGLAKLEAVSMDSAIEGKTIMEIQERFFKDTGESALDYLKRKHLGGGA